MNFLLIFPETTQNDPYEWKMPTVFMKSCSDGWKVGWPYEPSMQIWVQNVPKLELSQYNTYNCFIKLIFFLHPHIWRWEIHWWQFWKYPTNRVARCLYQGYQICVFSYVYIFIQRPQKCFFTLYPCFWGWGSHLWHFWVCSNKMDC